QFLPQGVAAGSPERREVGFLASAEGNDRAGKNRHPEKTRLGAKRCGKVLPDEKVCAHFARLRRERLRERAQRACAFYAGQDTDGSFVRARRSDEERVRSRKAWPHAAQQTHRRR